MFHKQSVKLVLCMHSMIYSLVYFPQLEVEHTVLTMAGLIYHGTVDRLNTEAAITRTTSGYQMPTYT